MNLSPFAQRYLELQQQSLIWNLSHPDLYKIGEVDDEEEQRLDEMQRIWYYHLSREEQIWIEKQVRKG